MAAPQDIPSEADRLARELSAREDPSSLGIVQDHFVEARAESDGLAVSCNLGGGPPPSRREAGALLDAMADRVAELAAASEAFAALAAPGTSLELYVFSGPMDFPVARRVLGQETLWLYPLDD